MNAPATLNNDDRSIHSAMQATILLSSLVATIVTGASLLLG